MLWWGGRAWFADGPGGGGWRSRAWSRSASGACAKSTVSATSSSSSGAGWPSTWARRNTSGSAVWRATAAPDQNESRQRTPLPGRLQRAEEGDEVVDLEGSEPHREHVVVEEHDVAQGGGAAVMEVRRARRPAAQRPGLEPVPIAPLSRHHGPTPIRPSARPVTRPAS